MIKTTLPSMSDVIEFRSSVGVKGECVLNIVVIGSTSRRSLIVIMTDTGESSITNNSERIATACIEKHDFEPGRIMWIEHYRGHGEVEETFDLVTYTWVKNVAIHPDWSHMPADVLSRLLRVKSKKGPFS